MRVSMIGRAVVHVAGLHLVILGPPICAEYTSAPSIVITKVCGVSLPSTPA